MLWRNFQEKSLINSRKNRKVSFIVKHYEQNNVLIKKSKLNFYDSSKSHLYCGGRLY